MVPSINHLGLNSDCGAAEVGRDIQFGDIEAEGVESTHSTLDAMHLARVEFLDASQLSPQLPISTLDRLHQHKRIQGLIQQATSL